MHAIRRVKRLAAGMTVGGVMLAVPAGLTIAGSTTTTTVPEPIAPASSGHAQVIAQGIVDFPAAQFVWSATQEHADQTAVSVDAPGSQFILADDGALLVSSGDGRRVLLGIGEATFDPVTLPAELSAVASGGAGYWSIRLMSGTFEPSDVTIEPGAGPRDVNLVRDVLAAGESVTVPSDVPEFLLVTAGEVGVADGELTVAAGESTTVSGGTAVTNTGTVPAVVVIAVIGDPVGAAATSAVTTSSTPAASTTAPGTTAPATTG